STAQSHQQHQRVGVAQICDTSAKSAVSLRSGISTRTNEAGGQQPASAADDMEAEAKNEVSLQSAVLIQKWYRRYKARLEARRQTSWMIYQSIEYSSESSQLHLYNFFNDMLRLGGGSVGGASANAGFAERLRQRSIEEEDEELLEHTGYSEITVERNYKGPKLSFPLSATHVQLMIDSFRQGGLLHARYLLQLLHETRSVLKTRQNIQLVSSSISKQLDSVIKKLSLNANFHAPILKVTVVGDLHGKLEDLLIVLYKNGLPDVTNPYIFNGDFVDRGPNSVEILAILFACQLVWPSAVFLNRGNHEDQVMNLRYGFIKEVQYKYRQTANKVLNMFSEVFAWMPLATVIDDRVFVTHGGISDKVDLDRVRRLDRHRYVSVLRPPVAKSSDEKVDYMEWRQVLDLLWSDPKAQPGCKPNTFRGGGCYFGPNVTRAFLDKYGYKLLVRSHECKQDGWEFCHEDTVLTVFSASNYYEEGSNKGAYVKFDSECRPRLVQFVASRRDKLPKGQRLSSVEESALRDLRGKILANKSELIDAFLRLDPEKTGAIRVSQWCSTMEEQLRLELPWRTLRPHLAQLNKDGRLLYMSTFQRAAIQHRLSGGKEMANSVTETVYKNKEELETIFRIMDKDNSGQISLEEFKESCRILCQATQRQMTEDEVADMAKSLDLNSDGYIDFNEFLEAFRIVDYQRQESQKRLLGDSVQSSVSE
uniref:Serine/threonine-protein phosphatase with EF-hands n=1 Tax=Macrostomum lignano TaxID=282301 RepID=A0A1I8HDQ7_9PLAT